MHNKDLFDILERKKSMDILNLLDYKGYTDHVILRYLKTKRNFKRNILKIRFSYCVDILQKKND